MLPIILNLFKELPPPEVMSESLLSNDNTILQRINTIEKGFGQSDTILGQTAKK